MRWIRENFSLATAVLGVLCSIVGGLIGATWKLSDYNNRLTTLQAVHQDDTQRYNARLDAEVKRLDARLDAVEARLNTSDERRVSAEAQRGEAVARIAVLESKVVFMGEWIHDQSALLASQVHARR